MRQTRSPDGQLLLEPPAPGQGGRFLEKRERRHVVMALFCMRMCWVRLLACVSMKAASWYQSLWGSTEINSVPREVMGRLSWARKRDPRQKEFSFPCPLQENDWTPEHGSWARFLGFGTTDILRSITLHWGRGCPTHSRTSTACSVSTC